MYKSYSKSGNIGLPENGPKAKQKKKHRALLCLNIWFSFTVQNPGTRLVKIDHVCFFLPGKNEPCLSELLKITHEKCPLFKMARSKASRKLYLQVYKANKLKKISLNSTIKTKKENNLENFYRQR